MEASNNMSLANYPIEIRQKNDVTYAFCSKLNLIAEGGNITEASDKLLKYRKKTIEHLNELGFAPSSAESKFNPKKYLFYLLIVSALSLPVCIILGGIFVIGKASAIFGRIEHDLKQKISLIVSDPRHVSENLNKVVNVLEKVTPERKKELLNTTRRLGLFMQPFVVELNNSVFSFKDKKQEEH